MIKKILLLTILIFTILNAHSQNIEKRKLLASDYLLLISAKQQIDKSLSKTEDSIFAQINNYFNKYNLDINVTNDVKNFKFHVHSQIEFIKRTVFNRLAYKYAKSDYKKLKKTIKQLSKNRTIDTKQLLTFQIQLKHLINKELPELLNVFIPNYLEKLQNKHKGIQLTTTLNKQTVSTKLVDIYIILNNSKKKKVVLLDKQKSTLKKPTGCDYSGIKSLVIEYKGLQFSFTPDKKVFRLPHNLAEMKNPISRYSFEEIPEWEIHIDENEKTISITLVNVEEFTTTLNK